MQPELIERRNSTIIMPRKKDVEFSYRMKYYSVENERLSGDIIVTQQTLGHVYAPENWRGTVYLQRRRNLKQEILEIPDFMALNRMNMMKCLPRYNESNSYAIEYKEDCRMEDNEELMTGKKLRSYPLPMVRELSHDGAISSLVDQLLLDIYGYPRVDRSRSESESTVSSLRPRPQHRYLQRARLQLKSADELTIVLETLQSHVNHAGGLLIRQLRRRDYLLTKRDRQYDVITAHLQAYSNKRSEDTRMRFSLMPQPGESGFTQWLDAMKMVASLPGGIPQEFRRRLWLTLAERHLEQRGVDWKQAEKLCFNEWSNPDDEELGIQIVKDLHRTGCSLFCGAAGRDNQAVLRRVLLGFARWNKSVGYCQGLNVLAALVLQVTDRAESAAVKVMIYLIEGVLPEGYFADNLRGLSVDMAVFRDLLRMRLPKLSKHLEALQSDAKDKATGSSYEPPLTNVFTMQWFLTLFCHCLPQDTVLRVWDLIFLEGDEVLLRTALAIWEGISDRVMTVTSADEFYSIMGVLTREMLEFTDTNNLIKTIVNMGPLHGVTDLREKHRYNITPWARRLSDDEDTDTEEEEKLAVAAAVFGVQHKLKKGYKKGTSIAAGTLQAINQGGDKERLALDISTLKHQYAKLRERQRQAHIILSAACARQSMVAPATTQAMNHLLVGKSALVSAKTRQLGPPPGAIPPKPRLTTLKNTRSQMRKDKQGTTLHWKDTKKSKETRNEPAVTDDVDTESVMSADEIAISHKSSRRSSADSDSDSTSTELCDDPERLSDSEDLTSASDCYVMASDDERSPRSGGSPQRTSVTQDIDSIKKIDLEDVETTASIARITDQIRRLSAGDDNNSIALPLPTTSSRINKVNNSRIEDIRLDVEKNNYYKEKNEPSTQVESDHFLNRNDEKLDSEIVKLHDEYSSAIKEDMLSAKESPSAVMEDNKSNIDDIFKKDNLELRYLSESSDVSGNFDTMSRVPVETLKLSDNDFSLKNYYDKSYVIGHLPISPITVNHKMTTTGSVSNIVTFPNADSKASTSPNGKDSHLSLNYHQTLKSYEDMKKSPKTPESLKSFSSGETMGPDSKVSSITTSPRTPVRLDSCNYRSDKSHSSTSSDDKTLTIQSIDSEMAQFARKTESKCSLDNLSPSTTISIDSLKNKSEMSPNNIVISSSGESCCPEKIKSSEISFSSELNSSTSANSIKYTSAYKNQENLSADVTDMKATSPFYPISSSDKQFTSPTTKDVKIDRVEFDERDSVESSPLKLNIYSRSCQSSQSKVDDYDSAKPFEAVLEATLASRIDRNSSPIGVHQRERKADGRIKRFLKNDDLNDELENDTISPLPRDKYTSLKLSLDMSNEDFSTNLNVKKCQTKLFERSSSVIDKKLNDIKLSSSSEDFVGTKKRSSDILDDLRHMEANVLETTMSSDMNMTRKTGYDWEDLKNLEARRQDTFSDSASGFSQARLDLPSITTSNEIRKTYVVEPKMQIDETSDSILKNYTKQKENGEPDRESKLGVWTKVKPRKKGENGRRSSSDRALKIIQENSAILHKILTCQAKKRLPDLEEISKEITISPINEEISKIFSPILEKMGLNEHEINQELSRINFKEFDQIKATNGSEFDAKIHDELSKLSIIDDSEDINPLDVDEMISDDYLTTREALIDKQINEELSKLLANYDRPSSIDRHLLDTYDKISCSQNETEGLDLTSISTNVFSYKSSNDSIEMRSELSSIHGSVEKFHYSDNVPPLAYPSTTSKYDIQNLSPRSDIDIYRELDKLNKISSGQVLPTPLPETSSVDSPCAYGNNLPSYETLPSLDYMKPEKPFENNALKSPYDSYKSCDFQKNITEISPTQISKLNSTDIKSYDNNLLTRDFEFGFESSAGTGIHNYEINKRQMLSKETLEFRVRYDDDNLPSEQGLCGYYYGRDESSNLPISRATLSSVLSPSLDYHQSRDQTDAAYSNKYSTKLSQTYFTTSPADYEPKSYKLSPYTDDMEMAAYQLYPKESHPPISPSNYQFQERTSDRLSPYNPKLDIDQMKKYRVQLDDEIGSSLKFTEGASRDSIAYRKASMTLGPLDNMSRVSGTGQSPKSQFNPFPVRNTTRKPKELTLKLGLYSPSSPGKSS